MALPLDMYVYACPHAGLTIVMMSTCLIAGAWMFLAAMSPSSADTSTRADFFAVGVT